MSQSVTVYFDLETAGLSDTAPDIQIAAAAIDDLTGEELSHFEAKIKFDEAFAEPGALELNHYDRAVWTTEAVDVDLAIRAFGIYLNRYRCIHMVSKRTGRAYTVAKLAGHYAADFDGPRLKRLFERHGAFLPADMRIRCTVQRALWWFDERPELAKPTDYKLGTLCAYFGIPVPKEEAHTALGDVRLVVALARAMKGGAVAARS